MKPGVILLDRSLEDLPLFRLSDTPDEAGISYTAENGGRWRVLSRPGERLPGTFDQDVYVELMRRYHDAGEPADGALKFTLHAFLRSMNRRVDGRTYEQLRMALARLERTTLESVGSYFDAGGAAYVDGTFTVLSSVVIERRRSAERHQLPLFPVLVGGEPGDARVVLSSVVRQNIAARHVVALSSHRYAALASPVARRLYRLLESARTQGMVTWRIALDRLRDQLPLAQRYPSHLQRVLQPAHEMLRDVGIIRDATVRQQKRDWYVDYVLAAKGLP